MYKCNEEIAPPLSVWLVICCRLRYSVPVCESCTRVCRTKLKPIALIRTRYVLTQEIKCLIDQKLLVFLHKRSHNAESRGYLVCSETLECSKNRLHAVSRVLLFSGPHNKGCSSQFSSRATAVHYLC
ncbi:hypothetical protein ILYODFUR_019842 [Ilyodon furcidens]|uniref:Secreted protein n=1 Tax=Ilyodon furcidens TaxID=33524 RepID=A0ABV0UHF9_9TELE